PTSQFPPSSLHSSPRFTSRGSSQDGLCGSDQLTFPCTHHGSRSWLASSSLRGAACCSGADACDGGRVARLEREGASSSVARLFPGFAALNPGYGYRNTLPTT